MSQAPDQQPPHEPTPEQQEFMDMLGQEPYVGYFDELQHTVEEEAKGDPTQAERLKQDLLRRLISQFPPLKDAYNRAYPEARPPEK